MFRRLCLLSSCFLISAALSAQVFPAGEGSRGSIWVGVAVSTFNPDYGCHNSSAFTCWNHQLLGIAPYVDANQLLAYRIGVEGEARFSHWRGPGILTEDSYLAGPRMALWSHRNFTVDGKLLLSEARMTLPRGVLGNGTYFAYAPGAEVDYRLSRRIAARADYEYQIWPTFKGRPTGSGGLSPNGFSFGLSYAILR